MRLLLLSALITTGLSSVPYYGARVGTFITQFHDVKGEVYAVDDKTLYIHQFNYDGKGADTVFYAGSSDNEKGSGFVIPHVKDSDEFLGAYHNKNILLSLPDGKKVEDLIWLAVWSRKYSTSFGSVFFPKPFSAPRSRIIGPLISDKPGISTGNILILDSQTLLVPEFNYDASSGKGLYWWLSKGEIPNKNGLRLAPEDGSELPLQGHQNRTVIVTLPEGYSVFEYNFLSLWNPSESEDYGTVELEWDLNIPPSPRALGLGTEAEGNKLNCEMLNDNLGLEVRWQITGNNIIIALVGKIDQSEYMALGLSKDDTETRFDASDAVVAWMDMDGRGHATDYYFENMNVCENGHGMCPDIVHEGFANDLTLLDAKKFVNKTIVTFQRSLKADDKSYDQNIYTDGPQAILWAVGPILNGDVIGKPKLRTRGNLLLDFGREPNWNCPTPRDETVSDEKPIQQPEKQNAFQIYCPNNHVFRAQMGPSISDRNRNVWYINGLPTPKLTVQRGQEYTFIVEGGMGPAFRNPLYITNSSEGGLYQNLLEASDIPEVFFAGVHQDVASGIYLPTSEGRLCQWSLSNSDPESSITTSHAENTSALTVYCEPGNFAKLLWTPDSETPNEVYYQSFTAKNIGGRIQVLDFCEEPNPHAYVENISLNSEERISLKGHSHKLEIEQKDSDKRSESPHSQAIIEIGQGLTLETAGESDYSDSKRIINFDSIDRETEDNEEEDHRREVLDNNAIYNKNVQHEREKEMLLNLATLIRNNNENNGKYSEDFYDQKGSFNKELDDSLAIAEPINLGISQPLLKDPLLPHDESERSDKHILSQHTSETKETGTYNNIPVGFHNQQGKVPSVVRAEATAQKNQLHLARQSLSSQSRFKPQFEGGFVPLVLNPKEREYTLSKEFDLPPLHLRRPHRPFLFNESIPFHGSFKPGVPDFSGFNISHYTQDESLYPLNQVLDNLPLLSAPNPQVIRRPFVSINGLPQLQRPQIFDYAPHSKEPGFVLYQQPPLFAQLPNIRIQNSQEDLAEVSSQRVQVALQASGDKNKRGIIPHLQIMRNQNRNQKPNPQPNILIHAPPIQRRPDFVGESEAPSNPSIKPTRSIYRLERRPINGNKNVENQRIPSVLEPNRLRNPFGIRGPVPFPKPSFNIRERENGPLRVQHQALHRPTNQFLQGPQRTLLPHMPGKPIENPHRSRSPPLPIRDSVPNIAVPYGLSTIPQGMNSQITIEDSIEKNKSSEETGFSINEEQNVPPSLLKPESLDTSEKHSPPQTISIGHKNAINTPGLFIAANRHHLLPLNINTEAHFKKLFIPMRDFQSQSTYQHPLPLQVDSLASQHSFNQKVEGYRNKFIQKQHIKLPNITVDEHSEENPETIPNDIKIHETKVENTTRDASADFSVKTESSTIQQMFVSEEYNSKNDDKNSGISTSDHIQYDVPFGARLKPNEGKPNKVKLTSASDQRQPSPSKKTVATSFSSTEKNLEAHISETHGVNTQRTQMSVNVLESTPNQTSGEKQQQVYSEIPFVTNDPSSTTETPLAPIDIDSKKPLFSHDIEDENIKTNDGNKPKKFAALFLDSATLEKHNGRKNLLPSTSESSSSESLNIPPTFPENIHLPQISNHPPIHDNGTDYSILNHVLSLIGGPLSS